MRKNVLTLALAAVAGGSALSAQMPAFPDQYSLSMQMEYESRHVFRGFKQADDTFSPSVEIGYGDFYAGWDAYFPTTRDDAAFQEHQLYAGVEFVVPRVDHLGMDIGAIVYDFPTIEPNRNRNHEFYGGLLIGNFPNLDGLEFSVYLRHDADVKHTILEPGATYQLDFDDPAMVIPIRLRFDAYAGFLSDRKPVRNYRVVSMEEFDDRDRYKDSYNYYGASAQIFFRIDPNATLGFGLHYADAINQDEDIQRRDNNLFWKASLTMGF